LCRKNSAPTCVMAGLKEHTFYKNPSFMHCGTWARSGTNAVDILKEAHV
jgi:hypothetical protein